MEPDAVEIRVVGCLIEKQRTTPDAYPLSLNALRLACNQSTNRDPVVDYDEATVSEALRRLALRGWTRLASGAGSRARKYRHLLPEALGVDDGELALLAVLMLRGRADAGRAEAAQRAAARVRRPRRRAGDPRRVWSSAATSPATSAGRGRRSCATSSCSAAGEEAPTGDRRRRRRARRDDAGPAEDAALAERRTGPAEDRLTGSSASWPSCATELARLREALGDGLPA